MNLARLVTALAGVSLCLSGSSLHMSHAWTVRKATTHEWTDVNALPEVNVNGENVAPIIGVLAQEVSRLILRSYPDRDLESYIAASYVKFVEGAGGQVVPLMIGRSRDYYVDMLSQINGVLLPGGATYFDNPDGYGEAGRHIYEIAMEMNGRGVYMPVWGTCLGFELMIELAAGTPMRGDCSSSGQPLPLEFKSDFRDSRMFAGASDEVIDILSKYPVTSNFHIFCFTEKNFTAHHLYDDWRVMSVNHDWNGLEFISSVEHKRYPFYGIQFHPEKNIYEFVPNRNITHTSMAIRASQYFADFFVNETRRNDNRFADTDEEIDLLIYNYQPEYTGRLGSSFMQQYIFERNAAASASSYAFIFAVLCMALRVLLR